jgi:hypothetical protein
MEQDDLFVAKEARDKALGSVSENAGDWMDKAISAFGQLPVGEYTGEDIRLSVERLVGPPHHHNAWGAVIRTLLKKRYLKPTGRYTSMRTKKSHARRTPVYWKGY